MKFSQIPYIRPDLKKYEQQFNQYLKEFKEAPDFKTQESAFLKIYKERSEFDSMYQLASIKFTLDTRDKAFQKEKKFFNEALPLSKKLVNDYYKALVEAKYKNELSNKWGKHLFDLAAYKLKGFDPAIMEELKEEAELCSEYTKLTGSAAIEYQGKTCTLMDLMKFFGDGDRSIRKSSNLAFWNFFASKQEQLDDLYDKLVKVRHKMATKLGYTDFTELGYVWRTRMDFNKEMVADFRQQVAQHIVPIAVKLRELQRKNLGYEKLEIYDSRVDFLTGSPQLKGTPEDTLKKAQQMYKELSTETGTFFSYMMDNELFDVISRPGKANRGYCWEINKYNHPFIFGNFTGRSYDIKLLTHEAGHAFQYYNSVPNQLTEYLSPSAETAEIHSMTMEFLTYPWMKDFFGEDTPKYLFSHLKNSITTLPYGCVGDQFQEIIYSNPSLSPDERGEVWKELRAIYAPDLENHLNPYLKSGRSWQSIMHLYRLPFYYIDYTLAQVCAYQYWQRNQVDPKQTWKEYMAICKAGGKDSFLNILKIGNLKSPFEKGTVENIAKEVEIYLDKMNSFNF